MSFESPRCSVCGTSDGVRLAAMTVDGSAGKALHGCTRHAHGIARAVDDVADDLAWLQQTRTARLEGQGE